MKDYLLKLIESRLDNKDFEKLRQTPIEFKRASLSQLYENAKTLWYESSLYSDAPLWYRYLLSEALGLLTLKFAILDWEENPFTQNPLGHLEILKELMNLQANAKEGGLIKALKGKDLSTYEKQLGTELDHEASRRWERNQLFLRLDHENDLKRSFNPQYFYQII